MPDLKMLPSARLHDSRLLRAVSKQAERYLQQLSKQNDSIAIPVFTGMLIDRSELLSIRITFFRKKYRDA